MASMKIEDIEGIGPAYGAKLRSAGVKSVAKLLEHCCTRSGREAIASRCGVSESLVLKWVNMADLFRVKGVGSEFAELLEGAGVDTVKELRNRNAENLATKLAQVNAEKRLTRRVPSAQVVAGWVERASRLSPKIEH